MRLRPMKYSCSAMPTAVISARQKRAVGPNAASLDRPGMSEHRRRKQAIRTQAYARAEKRFPLTARGIKTSDSNTRRNKRAEEASQCTENDVVACLRYQNRPHAQRRALA
eukprot:4112724-Pleurochrysis_carterae.AAC.3